MMEKANEMKNEIRRKAASIIKVVNVAQIICTIGFFAALIGGIACSVLAYTDVLDRIIEHNPDILDHISIMRYIGPVQVGSTVSSYVDAKQALSEGAVECFVGMVMTVLIIIMFRFIKSVFCKLAESESPFEMGILKDLKITFVLIVIICMQSNMVLGIVMILVFLCLYKIYEYGCLLQQESDETL